MRIYKKISVVLGLLLVGMLSRAQDDAIGKFFGRYVEDSRFSVVSVSPKMFRLLSKVDWDSVSTDIKQTVSKLQSLRIISTQTTPYVFYKEALSKIDMKEYEELITVRDKDDNIRFVVRESGGVIHELLMMAVDKGGFTMMSFVGDIDLDKLARLSAAMDIKGMEGLKNVKRKNK
jgi:hypothetical protein